jgi:hypothetical protein
MQELEMNYSEALSFTFRDQNWLKKMLIGGAVAFASFYVGIIFIFGFFVIGYYIGVLRNVSRDVEPALPEWKDLSKIFVDGLLGGIISLFYFLIIGGLCALAIVSVVNDYMPEFEKVTLIVLISIFTALALGIFISYGLLQFAITENFSAAFSVSAMFDIIRSDLGNFMAIIIFSMILNCILFMAGLGFFSAFTNFWGMVVQAHLFGQYARKLQPATTAVQTA